jgi:trk system potassium uptake protein TrkH
MLQGFSVKHSIYSAIFHSISAFCNAGFSIYDSSMIGMNPLIKITTMFLIIFGGIGYYVAYDLMQFRKKRK